MIKVVTPFLIISYKFNPDMGVSEKMGDPWTPKVTMGFNTKMVYIIWMIWEYPHFRKPPYIKIYYTAQICSNELGRAVVRHNIGQINPSLRLFFGKKDTWRDMESDRGRLHCWLAGSFNPSEKYEFVSWDDDIPNWMESHRIPWFQSPPTSWICWILCF